MLYTSVTNPLGYKTTYTYDKAGNVTAVYAPVSGLTNGTQMKTMFAYDSGNRLSKIRHNGFIYEMGYDSLGTLTSVDSPFGNIVTYNYGTVKDGYNLESVSYGNGQTIDYEYDSMGLLTNVSYDGEVRFNYAYDLKGIEIEVYDYINNIKKYSETDSDGNEVTIEKGINGNDAYHSYYTSSDTEEVTATRLDTGTEYTKYRTTSVFHETVGSKYYGTTYK